MSQQTSHACRLYVVSPPDLDLVIFQATMISALDAGDVAAFQLQTNNMDETTIMRCCKALMPIAHERDVAFILSGHVEIARRMGCDGIHLKKYNRTILDEARAKLGSNAMIGVSCYSSKHDAMVAAENGADYISFAPFFQRRTPFVDPDIDARLTENLAPVSLIEDWAEISQTPVVASGGLKLDNVRQIVDAGADFACVSAAVWEHPQGADKAVRAFNDILTQK